jgi:hypothetical protein
MRKTPMYAMVAVLAFMFAAPAGQAGISRVAKRLNMIDFYAGGSMATGKYGGLGQTHWDDLANAFFPNPKVDGSNLYGSSYHLGFDYGQLRYNHLLLAVGFRYTKVELKDSVRIPFEDPEAVHWLRGDFYSGVNLYDLSFDMNYFLTNATTSTFSPYVGLGLKAGLMVFSTDARDEESGLEYADENELKFTTSLNFGADMRVYSAPSGRSFATISSVNSWDILGTGGRPRYLNIGGAIKYYFRP